MLEKEQWLVCECCWKPIEQGKEIEIDGLTICEECYAYHYEEDNDTSKS